MSEAFKKFDLTGRTAVVTGGSAGLGYYMARGLMRSGAKVVIAARREQVLKDSAEKLAAEAPEGSVEYATVDLGDRSSTAAFAESMLEKYRGVDIFVGNAGLDSFEPVESINDDVLDKVFQVNVTANIALTRAFLPHMREQKWGRFIYSSSATSVASSAQDGISVYSASKSAINAFTRATAAETGQDNITANSLVLGVYETEMYADVLKGLEAAHGPEAALGMTRSFSTMTAAGRLGQCEEIEGLIQLLASDAGSYITGTNLAADGGMSIILRPNEAVV